MFILSCPSFCSIVPCSFEFSLMPKSSLQECYTMLTAVCYQNLGICLFHCILCVHPMSLMSTWVLRYIMSSLEWCNPCIFVGLVVSASILWSRVLVVTVLLGWICYIMMLCKPAATSHYMHNMEIFTKDVLVYMSCYIHPCPSLHLYPALACCNLALKLLDNVAVNMLTLSSVFAMSFASDPCILWTCSCHA